MPKHILNNQEINKILGNILPRIKYLDDLLSDVSTAEKNWGEKTLRETYRGYLHKTDFNDIRSAQKYIRSTKNEISKDKRHSELFFTSLEKILPQDELSTVLLALKEKRDELENYMVNFVQDTLIPTLTGNNRYTIEHPYEFECNKCHSTTKTIDEKLTAPIKDKDFFRSLETGNIKLACIKCSGSDVSVLNTANIFYPEDTSIDQIGIRIKSGKRTVKKLINRISFSNEKSNDQINDIYAIRVVTYNQNQALDVVSKIKDIASTYGMNIRDNKEIEYINFPRQAPKTRPSYSAVHIDLSLPTYSDFGARVYRTFEIQVKDVLTLRQEMTQKHIKHSKHEKKQEQFIKNNWKDVHYKLQEYLLPLFLKSNI